jgi:hypothetical protein
MVGLAALASLPAGTGLPERTRAKNGMGYERST